MSLLGEIDLSVPLSPGLKRGKHATFTAHVTEGTLAGAGGTGATNSGNTGDGTTSAPGLGGVLVTLKPEDSMSLSSVFGHVGVNELNSVVSDGGSENSGHGNLADDSAIFGVNTHDRSLHLLKRILITNKNIPNNLLIVSNDFLHHIQILLN